MFLFLIFSSFCNMMSSEEFNWIANICRDMKYLRSLLEDIWYAGPLQNGWMGFADRFGQGLGKTFTLWRLWRFSIWKFIAMTFLGIFLLFSVLVYFSDGYFNFWIFCHLRLCHFEQEEVLGYSELFLASENLYL